MMNKKFYIYFVTILFLFTIYNLNFSTIDYTLCYKPLHNNTIWIFWDSGFDNAPQICQMCLKSWKFYNPNYNIIELDKHSIYDYLDYNLLDNIWTKNQIQTQSDLIRVNLLKNHGGIWVDATCWCNKPLDTWLHKYFNNFFVFKHKDILNIKFSSWFMASTQNNYMINSICDNYNKFWSNRNSTSNYFNFHTIIHKLYLTNNKFRINFYNINSPYSTKQLCLARSDPNSHKINITHTQIIHNLINYNKFPVFKFCSTLPDDFPFELLHQLYQTIN
jgi:hypothetical protein